MELLCQLQNIHLSFGEKVLFKGTGVTLHHGEKVGLLGLNGQGKTTLFKILTGEILPEASTPPFIFSKVKGKDNQEKAFSVFHVPQDLPFCGGGGTSGSGPSPSIRNYLFVFYPQLEGIYHRLEVSGAEEDLEAFATLGGWDLLNKYESYLKLFQVEDWDRPVSSLSGGEQRKLALSLGLSAQANLILWDEPTNHLDLDTIEIFEEELDNDNKAFILITHDRYLLNKVCHRLLNIGRGEISSFIGTYAQYLEHLATKDKTRMALLDKLSNHQRREQAWMRQGIKARGTRSKKRVETFHNLQEQVQELKRLARKKVDMDLHSSGRKTRCLVSMENLSYAYPGQNPIFQKVTLDIFKGDRIALLGSNGSGKSTLLKVIEGELELTQDSSEGTVRLAENLVVHHFDQKRVVLDPENTPYQLLGDGSDMIELPGGNRRHISAYFEDFLFNRNDLHRPIRTFSGGERNRLQLALFLKREADLWIFDEPTNDLDLETIGVLEEKLASFPGTILVVSHDRAFLEGVTRKAWVLQKGEIQVFGGGMEQAYAYLQAVKLEDLSEGSNEGKDQNIIVKKEVQAVEVPKRKLTAKEKKRMGELPAKMEDLESRLEKVEEELATYDFSKMGKDNKDSYQKLSQLEAKRERLKKELDSLFEEWAAFEE